MISFPFKNPCKIYKARSNISLRNCVVVMFIRERHFMVVVEICVHVSLNINNSILCNSLKRSSYCKIYMGQSVIVKVGKSFFFGHKSGTVLKMPSSALTGMRAGGSRNRVSPAPHTKLTPHLLSSTARSFFFKVSVVSLPLPLSFCPLYTLLHSPFHSSF